MPKSRGRKRPKKLRLLTGAASVVNMSAEMRIALEAQRAAHTAKFGREPGPGDPVVFDPVTDTPVEISRERIAADLDEAVRKAGLDPQRLPS